MLVLVLFVSIETGASNGDGLRLLAEGSGGCVCACARDCAYAEGCMGAACESARRRGRRSTFSFVVGTSSFSFTFSFTFSLLFSFAFSLTLSARARTRTRSLSVRDIGVGVALALVLLANATAPSELARGRGCTAYALHPAQPLQLV